jgi:uncharacterized membrane protein YheB (UPF0754 family)
MIFLGNSVWLTKLSKSTTKSKQKIGQATITVFRTSMHTSTMIQMFRLDCLVTSSLVRKFITVVMPYYNYIDDILNYLWY